ncbi:MAG: hypothetical protein ACK4SJ_06220 [Sphingorhabdus sp.]
MTLLLAISLSACYAEGSRKNTREYQKEIGCSRLDCVQAEASIETPLPNEANIESQNDKYKEYLQKLKHAPIYSSDIRGELAKNFSSYRQSYRPSLDYFVGLTPTFRCVHSTRLIKSVEKHGWQLVRCDEDRAVFFKKSLKNIKRCADIPSIAEIYDSLIYYPISKNKKDNFINLNDVKKKMRYESVRPTKYEIMTSNEIVKKYIGDYHGAEDELIVEVGFENKNELIFFEPEKIQSVIFHGVGSDNKCKRNPVGRRYAKHGWIELDSNVASYAEMSDELQKYIVYVR